METRERFYLTLRWLCFTLLLTAVVLRMAESFYVYAPAERGEKDTPPAVAAAALSSEATYPTMYYIDPNADEPAVTSEDASLVQIRNKAGVEIDVQALLELPMQFHMQTDGPLILIVHTHASEAYTVADGDDYEGSGDYRTSDIQHNVVRVGQVLADRLNANGIQTLHDTTLNDVPGYDDAYERTARVIEQYLQTYPSIQMVIDVHRDAIADENGNELALTTTVAGRDAAQLMLVMGTDTAGLEHPDWRKNLSFAVKLQAHCEAINSGLFREMVLRSARYNEHLTTNSILLEVGTAGNTLQQAIYSIELFADRLTELLKQAQE